MKRLIIIAAILAASMSMNAQNGRGPLRPEQASADVISADARTARFAVSTNLADWAWLGTANLWFQYAAKSHLTVEAIAKFNNFTFKPKTDNQFQNRQQTYAVGMRYWPWYTYSGWWFGGRAQYQEYNRGGIANPTTEEGDALGVGVNGGYSVQVTKWFNVDFGIGFWGGGKKYVVYSCPTCGHVEEQGTKAFFAPNEVMISAMFIF